MEHIHRIKQQSRDNRRELLKEMRDADIIPENEYKEVLKYSDKYDQLWKVCPELGVVLECAYDEALEIDKEHRFVSEIKTAINEVYNMFNIARLFCDV